MDLDDYEKKEYLSHFRDGISKEIEEYAINEAFKFSRYIFTHRVGKQQYGYCTHCKKEFKVDGLKHNSKVVCPHCNSECTVKASGRGRKYMVDEVYFTYYEKSVINPKSIVARGIFAYRNYKGDYKNVKTNYDVTAFYIFEMGKSTMLDRWDSSFFGEHFVKRKNVYSNFMRDHIAHIRSCYSMDSIKNAIKDTQFQYSTWESYYIDDMVKFFDLYSKYPCIEYLTKLGFKELVNSKLYDRHTYSAINWRGKTILQVLKLKKEQLNLIKNSGYDIDPLALRLYQMALKEKSDLSFKEIKKMSDDYEYYFKELQSVNKYASLRKIYNYITKQFDKGRADNKASHYYYKYDVLVTWKDYIADCITLEMDLNNEIVLFPKDIYTAHQNTINQIKYRADEALNEKIRKRLKDLIKRYSFEHLGLLIRPANSSVELINEGKALNHCVGGYAKGYAEGTTTILFIRKLSDPDKPYYTMEVLNNDIRQTRGLKNCAPTDEVKEFLEAFTNTKLEKKSKTKIKIPA